MADDPTGTTGVHDPLQLGVLAQLAPDRVDAEELVEALEGADDRARGELASGLATVAADRPAAVLPYRDRIAGVAGEVLGDQIPLFRAIGATAGRFDPGLTTDLGEDRRRESTPDVADGPEEDEDVVEFLVNRLLGPPSRTAAAEGLAWAAEADPAAVAAVSPDPLSVLRNPVWDGPGPARSALYRALATLYAADVEGPDGAIRPRIDATLEAGGSPSLAFFRDPAPIVDDPPPRAAAIAAVSLAAADGCRAAVDRLDEVVAVLTGGLVPVLTPKPGVVDAALVGLDAVADEQPATLVDYAGTLLEARTERLGRYVESDLWSILARVAVESDPVFETILEEVAAESGTLGGLESILGNGARYRAVLSVAAPERSALLAARVPDVEAVFEAYPETGADLVASVAREDPSAVAWAVDPLLERTLGGDAIQGGKSTLNALGVLATAYPRVATATLAEVGQSDPGENALRACREVAETAPGALASTTAPVETLLDAANRGAAPDRALRAAAALGRARPSALEPFVEDVSELVATTSYYDVTPRERAATRLGSVAVRTAPDELESTGEIVFDLVARGEEFQLLDPDLELDGLASLLGAFAWAFDRFAETTLEWFDEVDVDRQRTLLSVFAEATWAEGTAVADHLPALLAATDEVQDGRADATGALACALADCPDPPEEATDRLLDRCYDPDPAVRRWAAFGLGEWLGDLATPPGEPLDRLTALSDAGDTGPVATLALVRAGERDPTDHVPALERAALSDARAIALTAVRTLESTGDPAARSALSRVRFDADDGWVRAAGSTRKN